MDTTCPRASKSVWETLLSINPFVTFISEGNIVGTERVIDYKDVSKDLGNAIYFNVSDIKDQEIGRKLYLEGEIEVDGPTAALIKKFADQIFYAYVKFPLFKLLDSALNQNKE